MTDIFIRSEWLMNPVRATRTLNIPADVAAEESQIPKTCQGSGRILKDFLQMSACLSDHCFAADIAQVRTCLWKA